jgi:4a-hydroxytetrahydrobiopterin dehydratase
VARPPLLSPDAVTAALEALPDWSGDTTGIERTVTRIDFQRAAATMAELAAIAEELDHHPDVDVRWRTLRIFLVSHSAGGVTELDLEFARRVDDLFRPLHETDPELAAHIDRLFAEARARKAERPDSGA